MKITINVDCTPEEARAFLGLPDIGPMNATLMQEMQARLLQAATTMDPETLLKTWTPVALQGWEQVQKSFWSQMASGAGGTSEKGGMRK